MILYGFDILNDYPGCFVENWSQEMKHEIRQNSWQAKAIVWLRGASHLDQDHNYGSGKKMSWKSYIVNEAVS